MSQIFFTQTQLVGTNKLGILPKDKDGYYTQAIGGLNIHNTSGHLYTAEAEVRALFTDAASFFMKNIRDGTLRGEVDHPEWPHDMPEDAYAARMLEIRPTNTCVHWADIWLDDTLNKNEDGSPIWTIMAKFCPSGVHGAMLEKQLANGRENVCFSLRAFTMDRVIRGKRHRRIVEPITFDYVNRPGIPIAEKWKSPALETHHELAVNKAMFDRAFRGTGNNLGLENSAVSQEHLYKQLGFDKHTGPSFFGWNKTR